MQTGKIGVTTENIFPIIKKFLYSDHEIFLRELVSNAVDATTKLKALSSLGGAGGELGDLSISVDLDEATRTLTISDRGIGMTEAEVERYINQIAFSGAEEFMAKYEGQTGIIGHFGLGFYSAFMVAERVEVITKSYKDGAKAVRWECDGTPEYSLTEVEKEHRGTDIVLHIGQDSAEFATKARIAELLRKYCSFLPVAINFDGAQINDTTPLWTQKPSEIKAEQYDEFYHKLYPMADDALFHIHLNVDYPFNLTGILYFPRLRNNFEIQKNKIQLYCNQVFVTDSVEGIVPEFLTLLHGVIDSPDIPLNVSRSYLQSDSNVKKISSHITKKVADRLSEIFKNSRPEYESKWDDLKLFIQYGTVSDEKFGDRASEFTLLKNVDGKYFSLDEYAQVIKENQTDKDGKIVHLYSNDATAQHSFIEAAKAKGYDVLLMDSPLEAHFIAMLEHKHQDWKFTRIDSDVVEKLIAKKEQLSMALSSDQQELLRPVFESSLPTPDAQSKAMYHVQFEAMGSEDMPVVITQNEFMRRMKDMSRMGGGGGMDFYGQMPDTYNVVINGNHPLVVEVLEKIDSSTLEAVAKLDDSLNKVKSQQKALEELTKDKPKDQLSDQEKEEQSSLSTQAEQIQSSKNEALRKAGLSNPMVSQIIDLAMLSAGMLKGQSLTEFVRRSVSMIRG